MGFISRYIERAYRKVLFTRHDPDGRIFYFSHSDFEGLNKLPFDFKSKKGHTLKGGFYYYDNPRADRLIVFDHGLGTGHRAYMREIEMLCKAGYLVCSYDHTGCGESEGDNVMGLSGSLSDLDDCLKVLKAAENLKGMEISVVGHSWGGYSALNILCFHPDVHSVVAMSGFLSVEIMHQQIVPLGIPLYTNMLYRIERRANKDYVDSSATSVLRKTDKPVLVIHSLDDSVVSAKKNILYLRKHTYNKPNIEFIVQSGKGHSVTYTLEAAEYKREFFKDLEDYKKQGLLYTDEEKAEFIDYYDWHEMTAQDEELWEKIYEFLAK